MDPVKTPDGQIVVVDPYGSVGTAPPAQLGVLIQQGYRFATPEENHGQWLRNEYGQSPGTAALEGVARSASFGLYDVGARAIGEGEAVSARRRLNPGAAMAGELAGYAVPGAAGKLLGRAGAAAVGGVGLGEVATIGGKVAAGAVRAGTEGALVGVQQTVSDVALSDHPLSAETIAAELGSNVLYGALTGGGVGGALGGLGGLMTGASSRVHARAQVVSERMAAETETRAALSPAAQAAQAAAEAGPPKEWADLLRPSDFTPEEFARRKALLDKIGDSEKALLARPEVDADPIFGTYEGRPKGWTDIVKARGAAKPGLPGEFFAPRGDTVVEAGKGEATANLRSPRAADIEPPASGGTLGEAKPAVASPEARRARETMVGDMRRQTDEKLEGMVDADRKALVDLAGDLVRRKPVQVTSGLQSALDQVAVQKPTDIGELYRGTSMAPDELAALQPGSSFKFGHLAPTTYNVDLASMYADEANGGKVVHAKPGGVAGRQPVMLRIVSAERGYSMVSDQLSKHLDNVLIPGDAQFRVAGRSTVDGVHVIELAADGPRPVEPASAPVYQPQGKLGDTLAGAPPRQFWPQIEAAYHKAQLKLSEVEERLEKVYRRDTLAGDDTARAGRRGLKPEAGNLPGLLEQHKAAVSRLVHLEGQVEAIRAAPPLEPTLRATPEIEASKTSSPAAQVPEVRGNDLPRAPTARPLAMPDKTARSGPPEFIDERTYRSGPPEFASDKTARSGPPEFIDDAFGGKTYRESPAWVAEQKAVAQRVENRQAGRKVLDPIGSAFKHLGGAAGWILGGKIGHPWVGGGVGRWLGGAVADKLQGKAGSGALAMQLREHIGAALNGVNASVNRFVEAAPREVVAARAPTPATTLLQGLRYAPPSAQPDRPGPRDALGKSFAARADELARAATDPEGTQRRIHRLLAALRLEDPKAANDVEATALRKLQFLWSVLPKNPALGTPLDGFARGQRPSDAQIAEFSRYAAAAETPKRLLEELNAGRLSPQTVAATKAVFPETFNAVRSEIMSHADQMQKLPYAQRVQMSVLFEAPLDSTMRPETVAALQHTFAAEHGSPGGMAPPSAKHASPKKSTLASPQPTQAQRLGE